MTVSTKLSRGFHLPESKEKCLLENIAFLAGEKHSDHPQCVSPVLAAFGRCVNDFLPSAKRQELRQYELQMMGTRDDGKDVARGKLCVEFAQKMANISQSREGASSANSSIPATSCASYAADAASCAADAADAAEFAADAADAAEFAADREVDKNEIYDETIAFLGILIKGGE